MKMWWILQEKLRHRLLQIKPYGIPQQEPLQPRIKLFWQEMIWKITQLPSRSRISVTTTQYQNLTANNLKTGRRWVYLDCFMVERKKEHYFQHRIDALILVFPSRLYSELCDWFKILCVFHPVRAIVLSFTLNQLQTETDCLQVSGLQNTLEN